MPNNIKYVSLTGLQEFYEKLQVELAKGPGASPASVLPVGYADSALNDVNGNPINSTYLTIDSAEETYARDAAVVKTARIQTGVSTYTQQDVTNNQLTIDLTDYALKTEIASAMNYRGSADVNSLTLANNIKSGDVYTQNGNSDVTGTGSNVGITFHPGYEYVAVVTDAVPAQGEPGDPEYVPAVPASLSWVELGDWFNHENFLQKFEMSGAGAATSGNIVSIAADGSLADSGVSASDLDKSGSVSSSSTKFVTGQQVFDYLDTYIVSGVSDVQVNGTSVLSNGVANIDISAYTDQTLVANSAEPASSAAVLAAIAGHAIVKRITANSGTASPTYAADVDELHEVSNYEIDALFVAQSSGS